MARPFDIISTGEYHTGSLSSSLKCNNMVIGDSIPPGFGTPGVFLAVGLTPSRGDCSGAE